MHHETYLAEIRRRNSDGGSSSSSSFSGPDGRLSLMRVVSDLFVAGGETTSTALNWAVLCAAENPAVQERVRGELDGVTGGGARMPCLGDR